MKNLKKNLMTNFSATSFGDKPAKSFEISVIFNRFEKIGERNRKIASSNNLLWGAFEQSRFLKK